MTTHRTVLLAMCIAIILASSIAEAGIMDVYFSRGKKLEGHHIYRRPTDLPGPTKVLEVGKDRVVYLYVIFDDLDAHTLRGDLKAADGKVVGTMSQRLTAVTRPGIRWRSITQDFSLEGLAAGEYRIELVVDEAKSETYSFTLK